MRDFIVVGLGIAGWSFVRQLQEREHSFHVFDAGTDSSTLASAGIYNPVILKRLTLAWNAPDWLPYALDVYRKFENRHPGKKFIHPKPIHRVLTSVAEQNEWLSAAGRPVYDRFIEGITDKKLPGIEAPYGFGVMKNTGMVDTALLLQTLKEDLIRQNLLTRKKFDSTALKLYDDFVEYKGMKAKRVVFAEGFGIKNNPFFGYLPVPGNKGEALVVKLSRPVDVPVKSDIFLIPLPDGLHLAGSTYNWDDKTTVPTAEAKQYLTEKLRKLYHLPFEIKGQRAGIRPTVRDRRPLLGRHPSYKNLYVLNGMGTRGVILAPKSAELLYHYIMQGEPLPKETDIWRFGGAEK